MVNRFHIVNEKKFPAQFGDSIRSYGMSTIRQSLQLGFPIYRQIDLPVIPVNFEDLPVLPVR